MPTADHKLNVFLSYSSIDKPFVDELNKKLKKEGWIAPWFYEEKIFAGLDWELEIDKAIKASDVVIIFLSPNSVQRDGYTQKEIRKVVDLSEEKPDGEIFVIPLRLESCDVPVRLNKWKYLDYFPKNNRRKAYSQLLRALREKAFRTQDENLAGKINEKKTPIKIQPVITNIENATAEPMSEIKEMASVERLTTNADVVVVEAEKSTNQSKIEPAKKAQKIPEVASKIWRIIWSAIGVISIIGGALAFFRIDAYKLLPATPAPTLADVLKPITPAPQPTEPGSDLPVLPNPTSPATTTGQVLTPLEFHGNEFTEAQIRCMTPTLIPISDASNVAFFPGGQALAVELEDTKKIGILDLGTSGWAKLTDGVALAQSPFGPLFLRAGRDASYNDQVEVRLVKDESLLFIAPGALPTELALSSNGRKLVLGYENGEIMVWDLPSATSTVLIGGTSEVDTLVFSNDGKLLASSSGSDFSAGHISIWDVENGSLLGSTGQDGQEPVFSPDGKELFYVNTPQVYGSTSVYAFNLESKTDRELFSFLDRYLTGSHTLLSGDLLAIGGTFWQLSEKNLIRNLKEHSESAGFMVAGSFEGNRMVSVSSSEIIIWDLSCKNANMTPTPQPVALERISAKNVSQLQVAQVFDSLEPIYFSEKGDLFSLGPQIYSATTRQPISTFSDDFADSNTRIAFSPDGKYMVATHDGDQLYVWDVENSYLLPALNGCNQSPIFLPDGRLLAFNFEKEICVWKNINSAVEKIAFQEGFEKIIGLPSGAYQIASFYESKAQYTLMDIFSPDKKPKYAIPYYLEDTVFSPDGRFLAAQQLLSSENNNPFGLLVFRLADGKLEKTFDSYMGNYGFSPDGQLFAIISSDIYEIQIYDTSNWQLLTKIQEPVDYFEFSLDGRYLIVYETNQKSKISFLSVNGK